MVCIVWNISLLTKENCCKRKCTRQCTKSMEMQHIFGMRNKASRDNYIDLLLGLLVKGVVTYKSYKKNRTTKPLSEWVTNTDEAFILLCLHKYLAKWRHEHWVKHYSPPNDDNEQQPGPESLYTGPERGTKGAGREKDWRSSTRT